MDSLPVYLLAGGRSSRFGSDKARADAGGKPLLLRVAESVASRAEAVSAVADRAGKYDDLGIRTIADPAPGLGPIGGLLAALDDLREKRWFVLLSCDWLGIEAAWLDLLAARARPGLRAVAFRHAHWEPLLALYHPSIRPAVERQVRAGDRAMWRLLEASRAIAVPVPPDWAKARQVNRPGDLV